MLRWTGTDTLFSETMRHNRKCCMEQQIDTTTPDGKLFSPKSSCSFVLLLLMDSRAAFSLRGAYLRIATSFFRKEAAKSDKPEESAIPPALAEPTQPKSLLWLVWYWLANSCIGLRNITFYTILLPSNTCARS